MQEKELENAPLRFGTNLGMILELHEMYQEDPNSVSEEMRTLFESIGSGGSGAGSNMDQGKVKGLLRLLDNIRLFGHLKSDVYPVYRPDVKNIPSLDFEDYGVSEDDLKQMPASLISSHLGDHYDNAYEATPQLYELYTGPLTYEYMQIKNKEKRKWLKKTIESEDHPSKPLSLF